MMNIVLVQPRFITSDLQNEGEVSAAWRRAAAKAATYSATGDIAAAHAVARGN